MNERVTQVCPIFVRYDFGCCVRPPTLPGSTVFTLFAGFAKILKRSISWQVRAKSCGVLCIITCHYRHPKFGDLLYILGNEIVSKYNSTSQMKNDSTFAFIIDYVLNKLFIPNISLLTCTTVVWKSCGVLCVIICHYGPGKFVVVAWWLDVSGSKLHYLASILVFCLCGWWHWRYKLCDFCRNLAIGTSKLYPRTEVVWAYTLDVRCLYSP